MRLDYVICVTGPARAALGPVRFLCTLLWGVGRLGPPWHRHWVLFPVLLAKLQQPTRLICVWGALGPVRFLCICFGSSGDLVLTGTGTGSGSLCPWPKPHTHSKSPIDTSPGCSSSFLQIIFCTFDVVTSAAHFPDGQHDCGCYHPLPPIPIDVPLLQFTMHGVRYLVVPSRHVTLAPISALPSTGTTYE